MCYSKLLKNNVYFIEGILKFNGKFIDQQPWGEVDWQSGKERWVLIYGALFNEFNSQATDISELPESVNFIDKDSIHQEKDGYKFESLTVFQNNPYFNRNCFDTLEFGKKGKFFNGKCSNGEMKIVGDFSIVRVAEPTELVSWINDIN